MALYRVSVAGPQKPVRRSKEKQLCPKESILNVMSWKRQQDGWRTEKVASRDTGIGHTKGGEASALYVEILKRKLHY